MKKSIFFSFQIQKNLQREAGRLRQNIFLCNSRNNLKIFSVFIFFEFWKNFATTDERGVRKLKCITSLTVMPALLLS
jgi:hypothetical protein